MACALCMKMVGLTRVHDDSGCPVRSSFWCSQCGCYGHLSEDCDEVVHVRRPRTLEELIPEDVRARWGIQTATLIPWEPPNLAEAEREIADPNTIEIRYREGRLDNKIRETMRLFKLPTVHKMEHNLAKLQGWAVQHGMKVALVLEK